MRQAVHFAALAPNIIVKIPVTAAGIPAIEEATYRGICINATVCFSLPQCVAVAEAVERGLKRREREGQDISTMGPVCTIMVGRLDDWLKVYADKHDISVDPGVLEWAGVAVFKKTYRLFQERALPHPAALRGIPQPHALERADRRRRRHLAAAASGRSGSMPVTWRSMPRIDEPVPQPILDSAREVRRISRAPTRRAG